MARVKVCGLSRGADLAAAVEADLTPEAAVFDWGGADEGFPLQPPRLVVVTVGYPPSSSPPAAGDDIRERVTAVSPEPIGPVGHDDIRVEIRYIGVDRPPE